MARRLSGPAEPALPKPTLVPLTDDDALTAVNGWWRDRGMSEQTVSRFAETATRFHARLRTTTDRTLPAAISADAAAFVDAWTRAGAAPELATRHARRTALRSLYQALRAMHVSTNDPARDVLLPPRGDLAARPLTDDEVALCRITALTPARGRVADIRSAAWALGEATAVSSEITAVRISDLDDPVHPRTVQLSGTRRHDARVAPLSDWGSLVLARRATQLLRDGAGTDALLAYGGGAPPGGAKAQASVCNALRAVLHAAGVGAEPDVRPSSLRHWAGRTAYDAGATVDAVARLLGHRSLDETAADIDLHWHRPPTRPSTRPSPVTTTPGGSR